VPNGKALLTLRDAAQYITELPKAEHDAEDGNAMQALTRSRSNCGFPLCSPDLVKEGYSGRFSALNRNRVMPPHSIRFDHIIFKCYAFRVVLIKQRVAATSSAKTLRWSGSPTSLLVSTKPPTQRSSICRITIAALSF